MHEIKINIAPDKEHDIEAEDDQPASQHPQEEQILRGKRNCQHIT